MFWNTNGAIINRLVKHSLKSDRKRNLLIILTIAFATCLMLVLTLYSMGRNHETNVFLRGRYQAAIMQMDETVIKAMKQHDAIELLGKKYELSKQRIGDYTLDISYQDRTNMELTTVSDFVGCMPEKADEILVEKAYLEHVGLSGKPGQKITLDLGDGNSREYTVCGTLQGDNESRVYKVITSLAYVKSVTDGKPLFTVQFRLNYSEMMSTDALKTAIKSFAKDFGIPEKEVFYSSTYFTMADAISAADIFGISAVIAVIVFACSIVIYSMFYISVIGKVQEYGRLRAIGTTKRQIRKMVRREGIYLAVIAIPVGLIFGGIIGYRLVPGGWQWSVSIESMAVISLVTILAVFLSIRTPAKMAGFISPIEAMRLTAYAGNKNEKSERPHRHISPLSLAFLNFSRNKKKTALTLLSLGFTGILLMCVSTYLTSIDVEAMAKKAFPNGEFHIEVNPASAEGTRVENVTLLQESNPLDEKLEASLLAIDGVSGVEKLAGCVSEMFFPNGIKPKETPWFPINGLTKQQMSKYEGNILEGTADYNELIKKHGILVCDPDGLLQRYYDYSVKLGDKLQIVTDEGAIQELTVMGIMNDMSMGISMPFFFTADQNLPLLKANVNNFTVHFFVQSDMKKLNDIEAQVFTLTVQNQDLQITTMKDYMASLQKTLDSQKAPLYGLITLIAMFGFINLANTLMTNVISRQREFATLQSVGLSSGQLSRMLKTESLFYVAGTMAITLTVGTGCGILLCRLLNRIGAFGGLTYHFPIVQITVYSVALLLIQAVFSKLVIRYCQRSSLVERIKIVEM